MGPLSGVANHAYQLFRRVRSGDSAKVGLGQSGTWEYSQGAREKEEAERGHRIDHRPTENDSISRKLWKVIL